MFRIATTFGWASCLACLAIAVAASSAFADEDEQKDQAQQEDQDQPQHHEALRPLSDDDSQSRDSARDQQRSQQGQQRSQQERQKAHQQRQRDQQAQQRDQQQWDQDRGRDRDEQQFSRDQQWSGNQQYSQQSGRRRQEGGLGVQVDRDGRGSGIAVIRVHRGSPADEMGIREGDRITHLNGQRVQSTDQFISRIRNMRPGEEVELEVRRDSRDRTFRGELEAREQALVLRGQGAREWSYPERRDTRQTTYEEGPGSSQGRRSGDVDRQISQIERQLSQLSREIEDLRFAVRDLRQQSGRSRETTARYDEYRGREGAEGPRTSGRWQDEGPRFDGPRENQRGGEFGTERGFDSNQQPRQYNESSGSREYNQEESIGGETGEARLHPDRN